MAGSELSITLEGGGPWGFRLQGGKDFGTPLTIAKVTPGGKAERAGVKVGDLILSINGQPCDTITHFDAQDAVKRSGQTLSLRVNRGNTEREKKILTITETVHSGGVDHKYNAKPKPFGAPSPAPKPYVASYAGPAQTGAPGSGGGVPPAPPPPPSAFQHQGLKLSRPAKDPDDYRDSEVLKALQKDDDALAERFKLTISDDGDVSFEGEQPSWHHAPPNPHVQSKTFKMLQKHLQDEDDDDDLPPPPPEAYQQDDTHQPVKSRSMKVLENQIDRGEAPASVFSRQQDNRSKPSSTPVPQFYRPSPPKIKTANQPLVPTGPAPVMARPGQPAPVALPGMVEMQPSQPQPSRQPPMQTSRPAAPQMRRPGGTSTPSSAPAPPPPAPAPPPTAPAPPPTAPSYGSQSRQAPQQQHGGAETKRQPVKPASPTGPREGPRTPYCESCQEEIFGPFVSAIGRSWHPEHFVCAGCGESLQNQGFIEEGGKVYCEKDYNRFFAPHCDTCKEPIVGPCVQAIGKTFHPDHFMCTNCGKPIGNEGFNVDRGLPYCEECFRKLFCVKCSRCKRPIGGGDRWVEALDVPWHVTCFKCEVCSKPLDGGQFCAFGGKPYCVLHGVS